ncbi:energy transducer TonB [Stenotrophomonas maltophilia]|jgi:protein TonB|uniref:Energy transducer TonB n=3 Tax=Stenotrophomonas TaxID=40323 RepID=A0A0L8AEF9_9GAMM|nr:MULTISPECIES: energy transducer TonB [Stenotrophomonas]ALA87215.1 energy transducer TonB [Stenotrophomonas maltophilia]EQM82033.1 TonB dependent receptor protein [Stenotrophomonas maltophilia MF89]ALA91171.1 energy transducer TonB [Stenotrophomonas maltophilia]KOF00773.1 energy transducer TonB [Stenotrophomonas geniculata N1]KRG41848.1 energy transducer TonB [Stenotrophomonas geniculata ATCC 19374 = JCM 13324]
MNVRLLSLSLIAATGLAGCGPSEPPAPPPPPPTEVAAVKTPPPQYPLELACMGVGGTSTFKVTIGADGKPSEVALLTGAGNPQLDELARTAVQGWQFKAATRNGAAVPATIQVPVSFNPPQPKPDQCFAIEERLRRGG